MNIEQYKEIVTKLFTNNNFDNYEIPELLEILQAADDLYYNEDDPIISDPQYDALYRYAQTVAAGHKYFTGIGSDVRGGKVKLPFTMGSLDQIYEGEIENWVKKYSLNEEFVVATDKLDGTSGMVIYDENGDLQIAYSRGNGIEGADITRHLKRLRNVPNNIGKSLTVRGENIIEIATFPYLQGQIKTRANKEYKNPRNMVSGLMNAKENNDIVYDYVKFVTYEIVGDTGTKEEQLLELQAMGFEVPYSLAMRGKRLNDDFLTEFLNIRRHNSVYEIDGIVLDANSAKKRKEMNPTRETLNPAYSVKYKIADAENLAVSPVVGITLQISRHGYIKPVINIEPTELGGVTISNCTGFNANYIYENKIQPGCKIKFTRSGDVIPFCLGVVQPGTLQGMEYDEWFNAELNKFGDWNWSENDFGEKVDAILLNPKDNETAVVKNIINFFDKIDAPLLKEGNVQKLYNANFHTIQSIIKATREELNTVIGENGKKIYDGLREKLTDIPLYKIMGAFSTERGIGVRRIKKLQTALGRQDLYECSSPALLAEVDGFDIKTAKQTQQVIFGFLDFYAEVHNYVTIAEDEKTGTKLSGEKVCMTGFRDKDMQAKIEELGGDVQSSVSVKTTILVCKDPNSNSGKVKKARDLGVTIMGINEFLESIK